MRTGRSASCACLLRFADAARCLAGTERTPVSTPQSLMAAAALAWLGLALRLRGGALQGSQLGDLPRQPLAPALALQEAAKTRALERDGREAPPYRDPRKHPGIHAVGWSRRGKHLGGRWAGEDRVDQASLSRPGLHCSCCLLFWKNLTPKYLSVLHGRPMVQPGGGARTYRADERGGRLAPKRLLCHRLYTRDC